MADVTIINRNQKLNGRVQAYTSLANAVIASAIKNEGPGYLETEGGRWWQRVLGDHADELEVAPVTVSR